MSAAEGSEASSDAANAAPLASMGQENEVIRVRGENVSLKAELDATNKKLRVRVSERFAAHAYPTSAFDLCT